jgi:hypothetical protein
MRLEPLPAEKQPQIHRLRLLEKNAANSAQDDRSVIQWISDSGHSLMLTKRIIACLDVHAGRVVKGVQFVDLVDAGDPATQAARHAREGADEIVLLDITATHEGRQTLLDTVRRTARELVCAVLRGRRHQVGARCGAGVRGGRGQGEHQLRGAGRPSA